MTHDSMPAPTVLTVLMFPVLTLMYVRLSLTEEKDSERAFGETWRDYAAVTPRFLPSLRPPPRSDQQQEEMDSQ